MLGASSELPLRNCLWRRSSENLCPSYKRIDLGAKSRWHSEICPNFGDIHKHKGMSFVQKVYGLGVWSLIEMILWLWVADDNTLSLIGHFLPNSSVCPWTFWKSSYDCTSEAWRICAKCKLFHNCCATKNCLRFLTKKKPSPGEII